MKYILLMMIGWLATMVGYPLRAQQVPLLQSQILYQDILNPAQHPAADVHSIHLAHQSREMQIAGWSSGAQLLRYQSRPMVFNDRFSWGLTATNDHLHTDQRIAVSPNINVAVLKTDRMMASLGISAGVIVLQSNFNDRNIYQSGDPHLRSQASAVQIDAGIGGQFRYQENKYRLRAGAATLQLPGSFLEGDTSTMGLLPHLTGELSAMYSLLYNLYVGPRIFYRNPFNQDSLKVAAGQMDIGLTAELDRQNIWFSAAYRVDRSALTTGLGLQLLGTDSIADPRAPNSFLSMNCASSYPLKSGAGPTLELGLQWDFNQPRHLSPIDTLRWARTFWKTESWMTEHKESYLAPNGPYELEAFQQISKRNVYLSFEFPDMNLRYAGDGILLEDTLVRRIGLEWEGMDGLMQGLVHETITEALTPDTTRIRDKENLEPLQNLSWVEFFAFLRLDEEGASFCSDVVYDGEIRGRFAHGDSLLIPIVVDDRDTILIVQKGKCMTSLELAAVKLWVLRSRFHYAFQQAYGDQFRFIYEGTYVDPFDPDNRSPIRCKKLRIITNHPHMQVFQTNFIDMKFRRFKRYLESENGKWIPRVPKEKSAVELEMEKLNQEN